MADKPKSTRIRNGGVQTNKTTDIRKVATGINDKGYKQEFASAGKYTSMNSKGEILDDAAYRNKLRSMRGLADALMGDDDVAGMKTASGLFGDGGVGFADIADSNNIGYYSYEFPVDALELPASRAEELRFYRLAYDRDPIVGRAIDMHTELPLSKMESAKPKCSSPEFADYIFDEFQRFQQKTKLFQVLIDACREFWTIGEAFIWVEKTNEVQPCREAKKIIDKENGGGDEGDASEPGKEAEFHSPLGGTADSIMDYIEPHKASWIKKKASLIDQFKKAGIGFEFDESIEKVAKEIKQKNAALNKATRAAAKKLNVPAKDLAKLVIAAEANPKFFMKLAKLLSRTNGEDEYPIQVMADFNKIAQPPAGGAAPAAPAARCPGRRCWSRNPSGC